MGLTIHYNLHSNARSPKKARELVARLRGRALDLPFERVDDIIELAGEECHYEKHGQDHPHRWLLIQAGQYLNDPRDEGYSYRVAPAHVIAFSSWPGQGCEEANFGLCRYPAYIEVEDRLRPWQKRRIATRLAGWNWSSFCKTQYASNPDCGGVANFLRCHLSVIRMLDHARDIGILQSVSDEGNFWQKRNIEDLSREVGQWNELIAAVITKLQDQSGDQLLAVITEFTTSSIWREAGGPNHEQ